MSGNPTSVLSFDAVEFAYPGYAPVLKEFSAELYDGEIVCVIGPSGCGKSTMLNLAGGFLQPDSGKITDRHGGITSPASSRVMVFQDNAQLFPWMNVRKNVVFPIKTSAPDTSERYSSPAAHKRADMLLELVGLSDASELFPSQLSGGMKQRAVIARALASGPEILLLDEPFTALDAPTRRGLQDMLLELNRELGTSMLFVTHDIREAVYLADRLLIMTQDRVADLPVELEGGVGMRDEFSDGFVRIERKVYDLISTT